MKERQDTDDIPETELEVEPFDKHVETDPTKAAEDAEPYFPPTDPVVRSDHRGETRIAGGFSSGEVADRAAVSDEALEDLVHRQLRIDASTAQLHLKVGVLNSVVRLQGAVEDEADAENALAVAGDVPGVVEVIDELTRAE